MVSALVAVTAAGATGAQVTLTTANLTIPEYRDKLDHIVRTQIVGYRTVTERKDWDILVPTKPVIVGRKVAVHGKDQWVSRFAALPPAGDGRDLYIQVLSPDAFYVLHHKRSTGKYEVFEHGTEWGKPSGYANTAALFSACVQLFQPEEGTKLLETADDEYEGRPTLRITLRTNYGATQTVHVDQETYQHLYSEIDKVLDYTKRSYVAGKQVRKTEYRSDGGRLWPTRQEEYQVASDGKKQMLRETTFLEYAPHTPTADELDIEKQFGIKPIPHEPRPESAQPRPLPSAGRSRVWLYAAAGVLAAAAVLVAVVRYRRPAAAT
jgi:hypothetical protein